MFKTKIANGPTVAGWLGPSSRSHGWKPWARPQRYKKTVSDLPRMDEGLWTDGVMDGGAGGLLASGSTQAGTLPPGVGRRGGEGLITFWGKCQEQSQNMGLKRKQNKASEKELRVGGILEVKNKNNFLLSSIYFFSRTFPV